MVMKKRVLFLCTGNSCRSQMAEGILNHIAGDRFEAYSAGAKPAGYVHPLAIQTLKKMGIDISKNTSKSLDIFIHDQWDIIITVCDRAKEACPILPGHNINAHWGFDDPASFSGSDEDKLKFFEKTAMEIEFRIRLLLDLPENTPHQEYQSAIHEIGALKSAN